jgi:hypothetical protein
VNHQTRSPSDPVRLKDQAGEVLGGQLGVVDLQPVLGGELLDAGGDGGDASVEALFEVGVAELGEAAGLWVPRTTFALLGCPESARAC